MVDRYRYYFDIDPEYFPQVNEAIINKNPDIWKKYYPHETFVKLIKDTVSVLSRQQKLSIWVEGAYGTGKSHAVLTLKKLLDASENDTRAYFANYPMIYVISFSVLSLITKKLLLFIVMVHPILLVITALFLHYRKA